MFVSLGRVVRLFPLPRTLPGVSPSPAFFFVSFASLGCFLGMFWLFFVFVPSRGPLLFLHLFCFPAPLSDLFGLFFVCSPLFLASCASHDNFCVFWAVLGALQGLWWASLSVNWGCLDNVAKSKKSAARALTEICRFPFVEMRFLDLPRGSTCPVKGLFRAGFCGRSGLSQAASLRPFSGSSLRTLSRSSQAPLRIGSSQALASVRPPSGAKSLTGTRPFSSQAGASGGPSSGLPPSLWQRYFPSQACLRLVAGLSQACCRPHSGLSPSQHQAQSTKQKQKAKHLKQRKKKRTKTQKRKTPKRQKRQNAKQNAKCKMQKKKRRKQKEIVAMVCAAVVQRRAVSEATVPSIAQNCRPLPDPSK